MADGVVVKHNIPAFKKQLQEFGFDMERKIIRSGVAAAALVFRKQVEKNAPEYRGPKRKRRVVGTLKRNIITKRLRSPAGQEHYFVGVRAGRQRPKKGAPAVYSFLPFYWSWVEAGHRIVPRGQKITGGKRTRALKRERFDAGGGRKTTPFRYIQNAYQSMKQPALQAFIDRVQKRIDKENAKRTPR